MTGVDAIMAFFRKTVKYWNSLPDKIATIKEPQKLKLVYHGQFESSGVMTSIFHKTRQDKTYLVIGSVQTCQVLEMAKLEICAWHKIASDAKSMMSRIRPQVT